jgi:hypothetical protein
MELPAVVDIVAESVIQSRLPTVTAALMLRLPVPVRTTVSFAAGVPLGLKVKAVQVVEEGHDAE